MPDIVEDAVKYTVRTIEVVRSDDETKKKLRARIRSMPSLLLQAGLRPTLAFYLSKTSAELVEEAYRLLGTGQGRLSDSGDKAAYALASALLLRALEGYSGDIRVCGELRRRIAECFDAIKRHEPGIETYAVVFLTEAKKIADALIKEEEE